MTNFLKMTPNIGDILCLNKKTSDKHAKDYLKFKTAWKIVCQSHLEFN